MGIQDSERNDLVGVGRWWCDGMSLSAEWEVEMWGVMMSMTMVMMAKR